MLLQYYNMYMSLEVYISQLCVCFVVLPQEPCTIHNILLFANLQEYEPSDDETVLDEPGNVEAASKAHGKGK